MFSSEANLNTPDSSQLAGPKAILKKKQHKNSEMFPHIYCAQAMLLDFFKHVGSSDHVCILGNDQVYQNCIFYNNSVLCILSIHNTENVH